MSDTNKREYKIAHYNKDNERAIFRELEWIREWLWYGMRRWKEEDAKRYWHESDSVSALITIRLWWIQDALLQEKKESEEKSEKTSWSEL